MTELNIQRSLENILGITSYTSYIGDFQNKGKFGFFFLYMVETFDLPTLFTVFTALLQINK